MAGAMMPHLTTHDVPIKNWAGNCIEDFPREKWDKAGSLKGVTLDFEELKRQYYEAMSMDYVTGKIHPDQIKDLGLQDIL